MKRVTVIDLDSIVYVIAYQHQDIRFASLVEDATRKYVDAILVKTQAEGYTGFYQKEGHKNYRKDFFPEYKGKRPPTPDYIKEWRPVIHKVFDEYPGIVGLEVIESDDALSIIAERFKHKYDLTYARIDKDLACIPGRHYNYNKKAFEDISEAYAKHFADCQVLAGDSGDSIPGVKGVGMKTAEKFLNMEPTVIRAYRTACKVKKVSSWIRGFYRDYHSVRLLKTMEELKKHTSREEVNIFKIDFMEYDDESSEETEW